MRVTVLPRSPEDDSPITFHFDRDVVRIGRRRACEVRLPDRGVSLDHARIVRAGAAHTLVDAGSTNGTLVGGDRLQPGRQHPLRSGDIVHIGPFRLLFEIDAVVGETTSEETANFARRMLRTLGGSTDCPYLEVVSGEAAGARLRLELREGTAPYTVGRAPDCDLTLVDPDTSRAHVEFVRDFAGVRLRDLASKNGVLVNGRPTSGERPLRHADQIRIGATRMRFVDPVEEGLQAIGDLPDADGPPEPPLWRGERPALALAIGSLLLCAGFWLWWMR